MENIKIILKELDVEELCLSVTNEYYKDNTKVFKNGDDIIIVAENDSYIDKIFGREIDGKFYFARHDFIFKCPEIDYYSEFFMSGQELKF